MPNLTRASYIWNIVRAFNRLTIHSQALLSIHDYRTGGVWMNIHEYQGKEFLSGTASKCRKAKWRSTVEEAVEAAEELARPSSSSRRRFMPAAAARRRRQGREDDGRGAQVCVRDPRQDTGHASDRSGGQGSEAPAHRARLRHQERILCRSSSWTAPRAASS